MSQRSWSNAILLVALLGCGARAEPSAGDARCEPGATRECTGPAACRGGQQCGIDGEWGSCDCGSGTQSGIGGQANASGARSGIGGQSNGSFAKSTTSSRGAWTQPTSGNTSIGGTTAAGRGSSIASSAIASQGGNSAQSGSWAQGGASESRGGTASVGTTSLSTGGSSTIPNRAPSIRSLTFSSATHASGDYVWVSVDAVDPDSDRIYYTYAWTCDGSQVGSSSSSALSPEYFKRGSEIRVTVTPSDGNLSGAAVTSEPLTIVNGAPQFDRYPTVSPYYTIDNDSAILCDALAHDPDGDPLTYSYLWYVNDVASAHTEAELPAAATSIGEHWSCAVSVTDGFADGTLTGSSSRALVATHAQGIIRTDTTWKASGSPLYLMSRVQVAAGATLTIEPGVRVYGNGNFLESWGNLSVVGTNDKPILLGDVYLADYSSPEAPAQDIFAYVEFLNGGFFQPANSASVNVSDCVFRTGWFTQLLATSPAAAHHFERNVFRGCGPIMSQSPITFINNVFVAEANGCSHGVEANNVVTATYNSFLLSGDEDADFYLTLGSKSADVRNNYWGGRADTDVPERISDNNDDLNLAGVADYLPTLSAPHPDTPPPDKTYFPDDE